MKNDKAILLTSCELAGLNCVYIHSCYSFTHYTHVHIIYLLRNFSLIVIILNNKCNITYDTLGLLWLI